MSIGYDPKSQLPALRALKVEELVIAGSDYQMYSMATSAAITILLNTAANPTVVTTSTPHGLATGEVITITGSNSTPTLNGNQTVTVISPTTFSVPVNVTVAGSAGSFTTANLTVQIGEPVKQIYKVTLKIDSSNTVYNFYSGDATIVDSKGGLSGFNFSTRMDVSDQCAIQLSGFPEGTFNPNDVITLKYKTAENVNTPQ
jgi:ribosomal protein L31